MERLLERGAELDLLEQLAGGPGCAVFVGGEAGIGKSSLIRALRESVADRAAFLIGACEPLSVPVPLGPLRELLESAGGGELDGRDRLVLARTLHDALAGRAPAVAVIEDIHWADPTTLDVIQLLVRRLEGSRVTMIATYRDDEVEANRELGRLLGGVASNPAANWILLRPLSEEAVRELAQPAGVDPLELARVTGGNPFLVVESINANTRLPGTVRAAALARAGRLSSEARRVVEAGAVIGQRFAPSVLQAVMPDSGSAVEEALARGVMVGEGTMLGFRHELIREAIEDSISPFRRAELHARVVAALAGAGVNARLAHHAELAGMTEAACRYAVAAAGEAERVGAMREVHLQLARALRLDGGLSEDERFELLLRATVAANFSSMRLEDAVETAEEAVRLARDPVKEGRAQQALALALWSLDRLHEAERAAARAIAVLEPTEEVAELARAHATHIRMVATSFDPAAAIAAGARALELADRAGLEEIKIDIAISIGLARGHRGDPEALTLLENASRVAREAGLAVRTVRSYVNQVYVGVLLREHAFVDAKVREGLELFDEYQTTIPGNALQFYRARSLLDRGRWDEALAVVTRTDWEFAAETQTARAIDGLVGSRRGESGSEVVLAHAWEELRTVPESSRHGMVRVALVEAAWLRGDHREASRLARDALASPVSHHFARPAADLSLWARRLGLEVQVPANAPEPVRLELAGDWRRAIDAWHEVEAPYEAALAALPGDERAARDALAALKRLGARGAVRAFSREREALGARAQRGPRHSTLANPAGLTRREQEVLEQLATGATNAGIAAALCVSERTVAHHVSAILLKLGTSNRLAAVQRAGAQGLLANDGQLEPQT
jgi:DNA-binding CsgD family transcriptional regulator/tetratricopeptide (TPR) repeat protein